MDALRMVKRAEGGLHLRPHVSGDGYRNRCAVLKEHLDRCRRRLCSSVPRPLLSRIRARCESMQHIPFRKGVSS